MIVFDIDGTLSIVGDRLKHLQKPKKDWDAFYNACGEDAPNMQVVRLCRELATFHRVIYVTGRRESVREITLKWLCDNGLPHRSEALFMRPDRDYRHDTIVKIELVSGFIEDIDLVFEDRNSMVDTWRGLGITCLQVADGDF